MRASRQLPYGRSGLLLAFALFAWVLGAVLIALVGNHWQPIYDSDLWLGQRIFDFVHDDAPWLGYVSLVWHYLVGSIGSLIAGVGAFAVLMLTRHRGWAAYVAVCGIGGLLLAEVVKHALARPRPPYNGWLVFESDGGSFPSGHTMAGIYVWAVIGVVLLFVVPGRLGAWLGWIVIVFGIVTPFTRLFLGVHWPSDVVGGTMLASGWVLFVSAAGLKIISGRRAKEAAIGGEASGA